MDTLFTQVLAALSKEGLIALAQGMLDGTKSKAKADAGNYTHQGKLREHLELARQRVTEMGDPRCEQSNAGTKQARVMHQFDGGIA